MAVSFGFENNKDGVQELSPNKTLLIQKFTDLSPLNPEVVKGLNTPKAVFNYFKPKVNVIFNNLDNGIVKETISFQDMSDFDAKKIASRSNFLKGLKDKEYLCFEILNTLKNRKELRDALEDKVSKDILLKEIKALKEELKKGI